mmetsp:Transcript_14478/g.18921  ORF Transcript_14478/g.18921 Transcript_14478/m.18921 type:complete len:182 (-) Transcript_14478:113-658(-)
MASEASMTAPATTVNSRFTSWPIRFLELKAFREEHGHTLVPYKYPKNKPLGRWVIVQRYMYNELQKGNKSTMTEERIQQLNSIGFVWNASNYRGGDGKGYDQNLSTQERTYENDSVKKQKISKENYGIRIEGMLPGESAFDRFILELPPHTDKKSEGRIDSDERNGSVFDTFFSNSNHEWI